MTDELQNRLIITLESTEMTLNPRDLDIDFNSADDSILEAVSPLVEEATGMLSFDDDHWIVKKVTNSQNIYIFPKSPAGY